MYNSNSSYVAPQQPQQQPLYASYLMNRPVYQTQQQFLGIKGRPVASIEEARASIIDFDGSTFYFPDLTNQRIYTKQINMDGTVSLNVYQLATAPAENEKFVTREEFEAFVNSLQVPVAPVEVAPPRQPVQLNF